MMNFLSRIVTAVNRYRRAKTLGFTFGRTKFFRPPSSIIFSQNRYPLSFPDENGVAELFRDILLDDEYWLESIPKSRIRTVLDIGANIGMFSLAARIRFPHSSIHAYEPNIQVKPYLDHQASTFDFTAIYEAVGMKDGRGSLVTNPGCDTAARVNPLDGGNIKITSLSKAMDRFDHQTVDLLKLDCEGHEHDIIDGNGSNGPLNRCRFLSMEYHLGPDMDQNLIIRKLKNLNFEILKISSRNQVIGNILAKRRP